MGKGRSEDVLGAAAQQVLGGDVPVVAAQERLETLAPGPFGQFRSGVDDLGTGLFKRLRHL